MKDDDNQKIDEHNCDEHIRCDGGRYALSIAAFAARQRVPVDFLTFCNTAARTL